MTDLRALARVPLLQPSPLDSYRGIADGKRLEHPHAMLISDGADENFAAVFGPIPVAEFLSLAGAFFDDTAYEVVVESDTASSFEECLVTVDWDCVEEEIAMVLTEIPATTPRPSASLTIAAVTTDRAYEDYMTVVPGNRAWVPSLKAATDPDVGLFVGYADGRPVVTSRLTRYGEVAEITGVQTLPEFRRRGYGRALTWAAIAAARQRGCRTITLTATAMGYPLYLAMGFVEVCAYRAYQPRS